VDENELADEKARVVSIALELAKRVRMASIMGEREKEIDALGAWSRYYVEVRKSGHGEAAVDAYYDELQRLYSQVEINGYRGK
jgi:hypothetical protein